MMDRLIINITVINFKLVPTDHVIVVIVNYDIIAADLLQINIYHYVDRNSAAGEPSKCL